MRDIEVAVIAEHGDPGAMMSFLARLTQRGADVKDMEDLRALMAKPTNPKLVESMMRMDNHGTIKRFTPITVAVVGASRRFLAQIRTHSVGLNFVSASLQYSDYTGKAQFVVPYAIIQHDAEAIISGSVFGTTSLTNEYLGACEDAMNTYRQIAQETDNDTAGYAAPQGLRNILIIQGNHEAWLNLIRIRGCNRNTPETQYVVLRIWEELLKTEDGESMFKYAGPDCVYGRCREGKMSCGEPLKQASPSELISQIWPLLGKQQ